MSRSILVTLARLSWSLPLLYALIAPTSAGTQHDPTPAVKQALESRFPGAHVVSVQPSPIPGLYEVFLGDQIVYTDPSGDYMVMGPLVDTQTRQNLTEARINDYGRIDFKTLPVERAIKITKGNGKRVLAVFSDPDCPFCQQLEKSLVPVSDVTIYVFLYPIASLHPQAPAKAHALWCAPDRPAAWTQWMLEKKLPAANPNCHSDPIDTLQQLGDQLHVNSTPTLFFSNGRRIAGALSTSDLEHALSTGGSQAPGEAAVTTKPPASTK